MEQFLNALEHTHQLTLQERKVIKEAFNTTEVSWD